MSNGIVDLKVGFVDIKSALIDSGASCNLIDRNIGNWGVLRRPVHGYKG